MSGGFGYYDGDNYDPDGDGSDGLGAQQAPPQQQKNPFRDHLKKVEDQNAALQAQVAQLVAQQRRSAVADALQAKGYDRAAAGLYGGEPEKLDEWLTNFGPMLTKQPPVTTEQGAGAQQGGTPTSTVPADGQAALQQMQGMGQQAAAPAGSEVEQIAQMNNTQSPEALMQYLQTQGNPHFWQG